MADTKLFDSAVKYAEMGIKIFPCVPRDKNPITKNGFKNATCNLDQIKEWWTKYPDANIGMPTGKVNGGIIAIDCDNHPECGDFGTDDLYHWEKEHGELPDTCQTITGTGGEHYLFRTSAEVSNRVRCYGAIDIRGNGGYIILPPSIHPNGSAYEWQVDQSPEDLEIATADTSVLELCRYKMRKSEKYKIPDGGFTEGGRNDGVFRYACSLQARGYTDAEIREKVSDVNNNLVHPPLEDKELGAIIEGVISRYDKGQSYASKNPNRPNYDNLSKLEKWALGRIKALDPYNNPDFAVLKSYCDGSAGQLAGKIFAVAVKDYLRFCTTSKGWMYCKDGLWKADESNAKASMCAKALVNALITYSITTSDDDFIKFCLSLNRQHQREMLIKDAQSEYAFSLSDLDADPNVMAVKNGVLNLKTLELSQPNPDFLISKRAEVIYDPSATGDLFSKVLDDVLEGDEELKRYLLALFGYIAFGNNCREECYIFYGASTRNGKTTIVETLSYLLGDYSRTVEPALFSRQSLTGATGSASPEVATLKGARLVTCGEIPRRMPLDESLLKRITGHNKISARFLHQNQIEFYPEFSIIFDTNYLPKVSDMSVFDSDRIRVIPFNRYFKEWERDPQLKNKLRSDESLSGIFNLIIKGYKDYVEHPEILNPVSAVNKATEKYIGESDKIGSFIDDCLNLTIDGKETLKAIYTTYQVWCKAVGVNADSRINLKAELQKRGVDIAPRGRINGTRFRDVVHGYTIREDAVTDAEILPAFEDD